jgi:hypothetical protein
VIQKISLMLASITAAAVLAVAVAAAGFAPTPTAAPAPAVAGSAAGPAADATPAATPATQVDTVYVKPAPTPKVIRVVKTAPSRPPIVISRAAPVSNEGERSGAGEDD